MKKREKIFYIVTVLSFLAFAFQFIPFLFSPSWYIWDAGYPPNLPTLLYNLLFGIVMAVCCGRLPVCYQVCKGQGHP